MKHRLFAPRRRLIVTLAALLLSFSMSLAQSVDAEVAVMPGALNRLSWGAIFAGALIALMIQLGLNLLGLGVGITTITDDPHDPNDRVQTIPEAARMTAAWVGVTTLIALFIGGWMAGRFAGIPNGLDGLLHGLVVWALVVLVTLFLLMTTFGRMFSSLANLLGQGVTLAGRLTEAAARGAVGVASAAGQAVSGVASAAGQAASAAGTAAANAANSAAQAARPAVEQARDQIDATLQSELNRNPELRQALDTQNLSRQKIEEEARKLIEEAGVRPERVEAEVEYAVDEIKDAAQTAAGQVAQDPRQAVETMMSALGRVLEHGSAMANEVDRQSVIDVIMARTGQTQEQAQATLRGWEDRFSQARGEAERVRGDVETKLRQMQRDAQAKVEQVRADIEHKVDDLKHDVDLKAREAASATTKAISRIALVAFAAIFAGAVAAGLGGAIGAPEALPVAQVDFDAGNDADNVIVAPTDIVDDENVTPVVITPTP